MDVLVTKADGEQEPFDRQKLAHSLDHAGAQARIRERIIAHIEGELTEGMTTEEIYRHAFELLQREEKAPVAARYSIKRAVFDLGPSGYPFEKYVAEILRAHGWRARAEVPMVGRCAPHEVDVLAEKEGVRAGIEVKFHNTPGLKTDVKDALYVHARFDDLTHAPEISMRVTEGWLVTNTRFTETAIRYARCVGLILYGWDYPLNRGLLAMIEEKRVHPLTCLTTLSENEKQRLMENNIVLCQTIRASPHTLRDFGIGPEKIRAVASEADQLCSI